MDLTKAITFDVFCENITTLKLPITANSIKVLAKRLIGLGFTDWDESTAITAKLLSLGLDDLSCNPCGELILEKEGWNVYVVIDDYDRFFVWNSGKGLTLAYPSLITLLDYEKFQVNPMQANRDTESVFEQVTAIINNISSN